MLHTILADFFETPSTVLSLLVALGAAAISFCGVPTSTHNNYMTGVGEVMTNMATEKTWTQIRVVCFSLYYTCATISGSRNPGVFCKITVNI